MRGLLGYLGAFRGDGIEDRKRPNSNVGMAFLAAAVVVAFVGFRWMGSDGGPISGNNGWTLGGASAAGDGSTTIPLSPAAVAVRIGAESAETDSTDPPDTGSTLPDGTPIDPVPGSGTTGTTVPSSATTTTVVTTVEGPPETTTSTTEETTTSSEPPTTTVVPPLRGDGEQASGLLSGLGTVLGSLTSLLGAN